MTLDNITGDDRVWAVRYDGDTDNALYQLLDHINIFDNNKHFLSFRRPSDDCATAVRRSHDGRRDLILNALREKEIRAGL